MKLIVLALAAGTAVAECPNVSSSVATKGRTEKGCRPGAARERQPPPRRRQPPPSKDLAQDALPRKTAPAPLRAPLVPRRAATDAQNP